MLREPTTARKRVMSIYPKTVRFCMAAFLCLALVLAMAPVATMAKSMDAAKGSTTLSRLSAKSPARHTARPKPAKPTHRKAPGKKAARHKGAP